MYCTNCETEVPDGSKYCPGCASPIATVESQAEAEAIVEETEDAIEELVEEVAEEPTAAEVELDIVQAHETGETERAQIAAEVAPPEVIAPLESSDLEGDLPEDLEDSAPAELAEVAEEDSAPTVLHPWFRSLWGK